MARLVPWLIALAALAAAGCTARVHHPRDVDHVPWISATAVKAAADFAYEQQPGFRLDRLEGQTGKFWVQALSMSSVGENGQAGNLVTARYFQSKKPGPKPLVIILPIWGVHTLPSNAFSQQVTEDGDGDVNVLQLHGVYMLFDMEGMAYAPTPKAFAAVMRRNARRVVNMVIDIRRIVDWTETRPEIDQDRIALVGFSLSAMVASVAMSVEPRIDAGVFAMGSASPHDGLAICGGTAGTIRKMVTDRFQWSDSQYRDVLKSALADIDPARFAGRVDPRRVLIIEAGKDTCLPAAARRRLWEAMGRPERIVYQYDHRTAFFAMTFLGGGSLQEEGFQFLKRVFGLKAEVPQHAHGDGPSLRAGH